MFDIPRQVRWGSEDCNRIWRGIHWALLQFDDFSRGTVRHGYLVGSVATVLLVGVAAALVAPGGGAVQADETVALSISPPKPGGKEETALAVVLPRNGNGAARVLQRPDGSLPSSQGTPSADKPLPLSLGALEYDDT